MPQSAANLRMDYSRRLGNGLYNKRIKLQKQRTPHNCPLSWLLSSTSRPQHPTSLTPSLPSRLSRRSSPSHPFDATSERGDEDGDEGGG